MLGVTTWSDLRETKNESINVIGRCLLGMLFDRWNNTCVAIKQEQNVMLYDSRRYYNCFNQTIQVAREMCALRISCCLCFCFLSCIRVNNPCLLAPPYATIVFTILIILIKQQECHMLRAYTHKIFQMYTIKRHKSSNETFILAQEEHPN